MSRRTMDQAVVARIVYKVESGEVSYETAYTSYAQRTSSLIWRTMKIAPPNSILFHLLVQILEERAGLREVLKCSN